MHEYRQIWSNRIPELNETIYRYPVIYDDYGMYLNVNASSAAPLLIVGLQNVVLIGEFSSEYNDLELTIDENDILTAPDFESKREHEIYFPTFNISLPEWGSLRPTEQ